MKKKYFTMLAGGTLTSMVVSVLVMLDTLIAGLFLGEKAVAGINLVFPLYSFGSFFSILFSLGTPILYTNALGTFDHDTAKKVFGFGLLSSAVVGILLSLFTIVFKGDIFAFFKAGEEISGYAHSYCMWMPLLFLIFPFQNLIFAMIFADGDESLTSVANITEISTKLIFSILLVRHFGVAGIMAGSIIGATLSTILCLAHFFKKELPSALSVLFPKASYKFDILRTAGFRRTSVNVTYICGSLQIHYVRFRSGYARA